MTGAALTGALISLGVGCWWGATSLAVKRETPNLQSLQERIMHAKNLSMRMEELFRKEQELVDEQASYSTLLALKDETEWLLDLVEGRLMQGERLDLDNVDALLDATGKTLRLVLDIGQHGRMEWTTLEPSLGHIHKTLCLASNHQPSHKRKNTSESIDYKVDGPRLTQLFIEQFRNGKVGPHWPFSVWKGQLHFTPLEGPAQIIPAFEKLTGL